MRRMIGGTQLSALVREAAIKTATVVSDGIKWVIRINGKAVQTTRGDKRRFTQLETAARYLGEHGVKTFQINIQGWENFGVPVVKRGRGRPRKDAGNEARP